MSQKVSVSYRSCINRNIVECKGEAAKKSVMADIVLIETSWNVKLSKQAIRLMP